MNKWLAVAVLGLSIVVGSIGWRKAVQHFNHSSANAPTLIAQGTDPVPPIPPGVR
jgi:hypothetical protein